MRRTAAGRRPVLQRLRPGLGLSASMRRHHQPVSATR
jgi:hypothetical protein